MDISQRLMKVAQIIVLVICLLPQGCWRASCQQATPSTTSALGANTILEIQKFAPAALQYAAEWLALTLQAESRMVRIHLAGRSPRKKTPFHYVQRFLGASSFAKQMSYASFLQIKFCQILKLRFALSKEQIKELAGILPSLVAANDKETTSDELSPVPPAHICPYPRNVICDQNKKYRTIDGSCNNRNNPLWGASFQPLNRFLPPDYADVIDVARVSSTGDTLPNARQISFTIHSDVDDPSPIHSLLFMVFGQFLDHDLSRTAISKLSMDEDGLGEVEEVTCGDDGCQQGTPETQNCMPIFIPNNDPVFLGKTCLEFVRTLQVPDANQCKIGPRQQLNQITSYLDGSMIYGSKMDEAKQLRDANSFRGKMAMTSHPSGNKKQILPSMEDFPDCMKSARQTNHCFRAGDGRVNEHMGLMSMHTIFVREHNRIEEGLRNVNPHWDGDRLFQETRRLVGALWQRIVYSEYLPLILGDSLMQQTGLTLANNGYADVYRSDIRPDIANSFATAAYRFGHSQIRHFVQLMNGNKNNSMFFSQAFRNPSPFYSDGGADMILRGFLNTNTQKVDNHITAQVSEHLFAENPPLGLGTDLPALNIQRGRDHGIPGYTQWRRHCRLGDPKSFDELRLFLSESLVEKFKQLYRHVDDIDLFPAGVSESPAFGAIVGPTFACIIASQFRNLRYGDRFWHENRADNPYPFTPGQLDSIRQATLAKVICGNSDNMEFIQRRAFLQPFTTVWRSLWQRGRMQELASIYGLYHTDWNEKMACNDLPSLNFEQWKELPIGK